MNEAETNRMDNDMTDVEQESTVDGSVMNPKVHIRSSKSKRNKKPRKTMKQRGSSILDDIQNAPIYWGLFAFNLLVLFCFGGMSFSSEINENFLLSPSTVAEKPWTIVTSAFMHVGILHFVINMYALKSFLNLDGILKDLTKGYVIVYVLSIFASALFVLLFSDPNLNTAGASGAIFGIFGAMITHYKFSRLRFALIITLAINIGISFALPMISWQAHMGGLALGLIAGCIMNVIDFKKMYKKDTVKTLYENDSVAHKFMYENYRKSMLFLNSTAQKRVDIINDHLLKGIIDITDVGEVIKTKGGKYPGQLNVNLLNAQLEKHRENRLNRIKRKIEDEDSKNCL